MTTPTHPDTASAPEPQRRMCANAFTGNPGRCEYWCGEDRICPVAPPAIANIPTSTVLPAPDDWRRYAKEHETTAQQVIERHRREQDGLLSLLADARRALSVPPEASQAPQAGPITVKFRETFYGTARTDVVRVAAPASQAPQIAFHPDADAEGRRWAREHFAGQAPQVEALADRVGDAWVAAQDALYAALQDARQAGHERAGYAEHDTASESFGKARSAIDRLAALATPAREPAGEVSDAPELLEVAIDMLARWCVAVDKNGTGWDDWDDYYKDAAYRPGPLRERLDAAIANIKTEYDTEDRA